MRGTSLALPIVLGSIGLVLLVVAGVRLSPIGVIGALSVLASGLCWLLGNRASRRPTEPENRVADPVELRWALLSILAMLAGVATFVAAVVRGW